jgi:hypothetical protein
MYHCASVNCVRFEVLTAVTVESTVFYDVTPCNLRNVYRRSDESITSVFRIEERDMGINCKQTLL